MNRLDIFPNFTESRSKELIQKYRNVFSHREASDVLNHMLFELGLFLELPDMTPEDMALKNYASRFLTILGGGEVQSSAVNALIKGLVSQPLKEEKKDE